jgi:hypothetical protein
MRLASGGADEGVDGLEHEDLAVGREQPCGHGEPVDRPED